MAHSSPGAGIRRRLRERLYMPTDRFRRRRMRAFLGQFPIEPGMRILDVGGTALNWMLVDQAAEVVLLNIVVPDDVSDLPSHIRYVAGDGTRLQFEDGEFDICFSNSTIEHVHTLERQEDFASEMLRVGRGIWLQTPARSFPFEPHWLGLFIHWLPERWQRRLARNFTLWGIVNRPDQQQVDALIDEYRLMSHPEMVALFPGCEIRKERFLGLTKSYIAVRPLAPLAEP